MPKKSKVGRCVRKLVAKGKPKGTAIPVCSASTGQSYKTGRKAKKRKR